MMDIWGQESLWMLSSSLEVGAPGRLELAPGVLCDD